MAVTYYSTDDDLVKIRPNILDLGQPSWEDQHLEAFEIINRALIARWYKPLAVEHGIDWWLTEFDPDLVDSTQLVRLSCYKVLELAYTYLTKDSPEEDGFERHQKLFEKKYSQELKEVLAIGLNYDWDASDEIDVEEKYETSSRRIYRA
jgi:hypothetical protein